MSALLHAALLAWALISIQTPREFRTPDVEAMAVSIITPDELTRLKKGARDAKLKDAVAKKADKVQTVKPREKPKPVPPKKIAVAPPPPAPEPPPPEPVKPEPKKPEVDPIAAALKKEEALKKVEAKKQVEAEKKAAEAKKKAEAAKKRAAAKKKADARRKALAEKKRLAALAAQKKKRTFDPDRISALLNKDPNAKTPEVTDDTNWLKKPKRTGAGLGAPEGRDDRLSASEEAILKSAISRQLASCWRLPGGGGGIETVVVTLQWHLKPNGALDGEPRVEAPRGDPVFRIAAEAAIRAVKVCAPFRLPADKYGAWKTITWDFDPSQML